MTTAEFLSRLERVNKTANGWMALCPGHPDKTPSLSVSTGEDGKTLIDCKAGCSPEKVCAALGITLADLFADKPSRKGAGRKIAAQYPYHDADGKLLFEVVRYDPKDFRQRRPDGKGGLIWNMDGIDRVLFRLPEVMAAIKAGWPIYLTEGEKDALAMVEHGFAATCNAGGAGKWQDSYIATLKGAEVIIIADKDPAGRKHAAAVAGQLHGKARSVKTIELPDTNGKHVKDAYDYFSAGGEPADLYELAHSAPEFEPSQTDTAPTPPAVLADTMTDFASVTAWIRGEILDAMQDTDTPASIKNSLIASKVVSALAKIGNFFFHEDLRDYGSAMFFNGNRKRLELIRSDAFTAWLSDWLRVNRAHGLFKFILAAVETAALSGPHTTGIVPEAFWAARSGAFYLSNGDGSAARITVNGVQMVDNGSDGVLFAAGRTCATWKQVEPRDSFETCAIFRNLHASAGHGPDLLRAWVYSLPTNPPCKPPLCLAGEIQSGKTKLAIAIAELFGVPVTVAKVEEKREDDFWVNCNAGGIYTLDNADTKCRWLADAVASAATDGSSKRRKLYTNGDNVILRANAWLCLTTANPTFAADPGFADRPLVLRMARGDGNTSDKALIEEIRANRDAGLSRICETLQKALADTGPTPDGLNSRHPDFAAFAVKIGRALGREAETVKALQAAEADKSAFCLENDSKGAALMAYLSNAGTFNGTAAELAPKLIETDKELDGKCSPKSLGKRLNMIWPHLQKSLAEAHKETNRVGVMVFTFKAKDAGFAGF
jgi:5S rRNA maturation endonuclease (ribonuclease M5)